MYIAIHTHYMQEIFFNWCAMRRICLMVEWTSHVKLTNCWSHQHAPLITDLLSYVRSLHNHNKYTSWGTWCEACTEVKIISYTCRCLGAGGWHIPVYGGKQPDHFSYRSPMQHCEIHIQFWYVSLEWGILCIVVQTRMFLVCMYPNIFTFYLICAGKAADLTSSKSHALWQTACMYTYRWQCSFNR